MQHIPPGSSNSSWLNQVENWFSRIQRDVSSETSAMASK